MRIGLHTPARDAREESKSSPKEVAMDDNRIRARGDCLGQTCLKWQSNGELSAADRHLVLERLLQADGCPSPLMECWVLSGSHEP
jgi:hypothetical protein